MVGVSRLLTLKRTALAIAVLLIAVAVAGKLAAAAESQGPAASFTYSPSSPRSGDDISFSSTSTDDGALTQLQWEFDDGNSAAESDVTHSYPIPGVYTVRLTVTDDESLTDTAQQTITVENREPSADFHWTPDSPLAGETVFFTSDATDPENRIEFQRWDLDNDGQFDDHTGSRPSRSFSNGGSYTVSLLVEDRDGGTSTISRTVDVTDPPNERPNAGFNFSPAAPHILDVVTFTSTSVDADGSIATSEWDLDNDGAYDDATGNEATKQFFLVGTYTVGLQVMDNEGEIDTATKTVTVSQAPNDPPSAAFRFAPASPKTNETITFTSEATDDGGIALEEWDLDNDGAYDMTGSEIQFAYPTPDSYTVRLRVTDDKGARSSTTKTVTVSEPPNDPPTAAFHFSPSSPKSGDQITFTSDSTDDGAIASLLWDLNDDGTFDASGAEFQHAYQVPGTYTVRLRVTDDKGVSRETTKSVTASNRLPSADFSYAPTSPQKGQTVNFSSLATDPEGRVQSITWDLDGDNAFDDASGITAEEVFTTPGNHVVRLRIQDLDGGSATATKTVVVPSQPPVASFDIAPASPLTGETVTFTSTSTDPDGTVTEVAWDTDNDSTVDFNDGNDVLEEKSYPSGGTKTVRLRVRDDDGNTVVATRTLTVQARPNVPPRAAIEAPSAAVKNVAVPIKSISTDSDGTISKSEWDIDGDGYDDGTSTQISPKFANVGVKVIRLRVTDDSGAPDLATHVITIGGNNAPSANFTWSPTAPKTGEKVTFTSTSTDSDGTITSTAWDLDDDGNFDDKPIDKVFTVPGPQIVRLKVVDDDGDFHITQKLINVVNRAPVALISASSVAPLSLEVVTFNVDASDPDGTITNIVWDLDGLEANGFETVGVGTTATRSFPKKGSYTVRVRVTDNLNAIHIASNVVNVANRPPVATFSHAPTSPNPRELVTMTSTSTDLDGPAPTIEWDTDNDGAFDDGTGMTASRVFTTSGNKAVRLRATDADGAQTIGSQTIVVGNRAPVASFDYRPGVPIAEQQVTFFSTSDDPDKNVERVDWDLDGDGSFETAGTSAARAFPAGSFNVSVRVTDTEGSFSIATRTIVVSAPPPATQAPQISSEAPQLRLLNPFPIVRVAGRIGRAGTRFRVLSVNAPQGATVTVKCAGRGCPFKASSRSATASRAIRIRKLEQRLLRSGASIRIYVTKPGVIGKFTRITIRRGKPPRRSDRCLMPDSNTKPVKCPS
jgi:PKD repeat protein